MPYPDRLNTLAQIDNYSFELLKKTHYDLQMGNFFTVPNRVRSQWVCLASARR